MPSRTVVERIEYEGEGDPAGRSAIRGGGGVRAWRIEEHGGLEVLELVRIPEPEAGPGEVRVRIEALALNHLDLWVRRGVRGHRFPLPLIPVSDGTGRVVEVGAGVRGVQVGDPVLIWPGVSCGRCRPCQSGKDMFCREYAILGEARDGLGAEDVVLPASNLALRPKGMDPHIAAAFPLTYQTAWSMIVERARVAPGERVLIRAAGSGVGVAALQIARLLGARVAATAGSPGKCAKALEEGAEHAWNHEEEDIAAKVREWTAGEGVEVVVDHCGRETFGESLRCLGRGGRFVTCGATSGPEAEIHLGHVFYKSLSILGATMGSKGSLHRIASLVADGALKPRLGKVLVGLETLPEGHRLLEERAVFGKVVIDLGEGSSSPEGD